MVLWFELVVVSDDRHSLQCLQALLERLCTGDGVCVVAGGGRSVLVLLLFWRWR